MTTVLRVALAGLAIMISLEWGRGAELGDPAPSLQISEWMKGGKVDLAEGKGEKVYVVEFWATWCPPCLDSIPHLTRLQKRFKDQQVVFVGVTEEEAAVVKPFLRKMGERMEYVVARDKDGKTGASYMAAFGLAGIPHSFVVDRAGRIVWHGHPMDELEQTVSEVLAGTFDLERARKVEKARRLFMEFYALAGGGEDPEETSRLAAELKALDRELGGILPGERFDAEKTRKAARFEFLVEGYEEAVLTGGEGAVVERLAEELRSVAPAGFDFRSFADDIRLSKLFDRYYEATTTGKKEEAKRLAKEIGGVRSDNVTVLNDIAWTMLTDEGIQDRELGVALLVAKRAYTVSRGENANITDTYARALFETGEREEAIKYAREGLAICDDDDLREELTKALRRYQAEKGPNPSP